MPKTIPAALLALFALVPSAASSADLRAHQVSTTAIPVGVADATTLAYRPTDLPSAPLVLRGDDGTTRTVPAPAGCALTGVGSGLLAGVCGQVNGTDTSVLDLVVTGLDGVPVARLSATVTADNANLFTDFRPAAVGRTWLAIPNGGKDTPPWTTVVDWHTGESSDVTPNAAEALDLDRAEPVAPRCGTRGRLVLVEREDETFALRRCGSSKPVALPRGFRPSALGDGWVAGSTIVRHRLRVDLVRLADRRRFTLAGVPGVAVDPAEGTMLLTHGRLYASGGMGIVTVRLPGR
jgi:hypothetical protein